MTPFEQIIVQINEFLGKLSHEMSSASSNIALGLGWF